MKLLLRLLQQHWLIVALGVAVLVAFWFPGLAKSDGVLPTPWLTKLGVFLIFFFQGVSLTIRDVASAAARWRLHLVVQGSIFLYAPLVMGTGLFIFDQFGDLSPPLRTGLLFLSLLPTTISSAVALTSQVGGDVPLVVFNTAIANLLAIVVVPLGLTLTVGLAGDSQISVVSMLERLAQLILVPMAIGFALQRWLRGWAAGHKPAIRLFSSGVIVFIVLATFSDTFSRPGWGEAGPGEFVPGAVGALLLLAVMTVSMFLAGRSLGLGPAQRSALLFCGGQKSLATGAPIAVALFGVSMPESLSTLLLPLLIYHPAQLLVASLLVPGLQRASVGAEATS